MCVCVCSLLCLPWIVMKWKFWLALIQGTRVGHVNKTLPTLDERGKGRAFGNFPKLVGGEDRPTSFFFLFSLQHESWLSYWLLLNQGLSEKHSAYYSVRSWTLHFHFHYMSPSVDCVSWWQRSCKHMFVSVHKIKLTKKCYGAITSQYIWEKFNKLLVFLSTRPWL